MAEAIQFSTPYLPVSQDLIYISVDSLKGGLGKFHLKTIRIWIGQVG